jgi:hypothetical protein
MRLKIVSFFKNKFSITFTLIVMLTAQSLLTVGCSSQGKASVTNDNTPKTEPPNNLYGGIEIGSKGVKATILEAQYSQSQNADGSGRSIKEIMPLETTNTNIMDGLDKEGNFAKAVFEDTLKAVEDYYQKMQKQHVSLGQIYIIGSSGLQKANQTSRDLLSNRVIEVTKIKMTFLNVQDEVKYSIVGIIPKEHRSSAFLMDIGSGNTKGGYIENSDVNDRYVIAEATLGTLTATNEMKKAADAEKQKTAANPKETDDETNNVLYAERVRAQIFEPALSKDIASKGGFVNRKRMYLSGGMSWVLATLTHPGESDSAGMVRLTVQDINDFTYLAKINPQKLLNPDLSKIKDDATRKRVEKEIQKIGDDFNQMNLMAGGELLQAIVNVCKLKDKDKSIYFARFAQTGWLNKFIELAIDNTAKS